MRVQISDEFDFLVFRFWILTVYQTATTKDGRYYQYVLILLFLVLGRSNEWADKWPSGGGNGAGHSGNGGTGGGFKDNNSDDEVKIRNRVARFFKYGYPVT